MISFDDVEWKTEKVRFRRRAAGRLRMLAHLPDGGRVILFERSEASKESSPLSSRVITVIWCARISHDTSGTLLGHGKGKTARAAFGVACRSVVRRLPATLRRLRRELVSIERVGYAVDGVP